MIDPTSLEGALLPIFQKNFSERDEVGASFSVWQNGEEVLTRHQGIRNRETNEPWDEETLSPVWSATKGPAAISVLFALHEAGHSIHEPVNSLWPELKAAESGRLTFAKLLSHQSGLAAMDPDNRPNTLAYREVVQALERQIPFWEPGRSHGYHPRTFGFLLDEVVRRCRGGETLAQLWNGTLAPRLNVEFRIGGLEAAHLSRLATMIPPRVQRPSEEELPFFRAIAKSDTIAAAAFASPAGMRALSDINKLEVLQAGLPSLGGVGNAQALARFYQILARDGEIDGVQVLPKPVTEAARSLQVEGTDETFLLPTAFSCGFMRDPMERGKKLREHFGPSLRAFGQPGAGGSHAFADPDTGVSFAYVMNQMETGVLPNRKSLDLIEGLYRALS